MADQIVEMLKSRKIPMRFICWPQCSMTRNDSPKPSLSRVRHWRRATRPGTVRSS